jgi:hypothetical protein
MLCLFGFFFHGSPEARSTRVRVQNQLAWEHGLIRTAHQITSGTLLGTPGERVERMAELFCLGAGADGYGKG